MAAEGLTVTPHPDNALSAFITVRLEAPAAVSVTARAAGHQVTVPRTARRSCLHRIDLVGLRPATDYEVSARGYAADGTACQVGQPAALRSGSLPADLPPLSLTADHARMAPGLTLFNLVAWELPSAGRSPVPVDLSAQPMPGFLVAVDGDGQVVWYYRCELPIEDARQLPDGTFLLNCDHSVARRIDPMGRTVGEWATRVATEWLPLDELGRPRAGTGAIPVAADTMHHEVSLSPAGNLLFLSTELREIGDPAARRCRGRTRHDVIGDVVIEADPASGEVIQRWSLLDVLDPLERPGTRLCQGGLRTAPPAVFYQAAGDPRDWSHANAAVVDERRNALLVSLRHLDAVVALRFRPDAGGPAGELLWELGPAGNTKLTTGEWAYHQHALEVQPDGSLLLYDNGFGRPGYARRAGPLRRAGDRPPFSRAVLYNLGDRPGGEPPVVSQRWEHRLTHRGAPAYSRRLGDADRLPNGNVLISHGNLADDAGKTHARIIEVAPDAPEGGDIVFDLLIDDDRSGWCVYRTRRIPSLYPGTGRERGT
jgi:hypothetical protein